MKDELSLENLAMPKGFSDPAALAQISKMNLDGSGGLTDEEIAAMDPGYDTELKTINEEIYNGSLYTALGTGWLRIRNAQLERLKFLFGLPDIKACVEWFKTHDRGAPDTVEKLVSDALSTGKWKELPDELQSVYRERKGAQA